ncbi:NRDE family protein [Halobiforma nitratireducens]|uniref:NRDE family protein n=1 Tax=Halobiforma nitratireducens JCM 10879 TaxID=1227454 RepID=M0LZW7_9EURY|nr:NRDE family protein [Halobiforma nitratireducens]EMA38718.1 hypothetical protein C446_09348 [Halobiforma nitratireducens JCM 10879]
MCTLTLAWQVFDDAPVAVAANRDESLERDSRPPSVYSTDPLIVAPRDAEAGGTWIGYNERGVFAGITNGWVGADLAGERSRGLLVADILTADSAREAVSVVEQATAADEYDAFNLVIADADDAYCVRWGGDLERLSFDPGVHVVVNVAVDDDARIPPERTEAARAQADNARAVRHALTVETDGTGEPTETVDGWLERAGTVLADHEYGVCVHRNGFGTRSSSLIALADGGNEEGGPVAASYSFAAGPPCRTEYESVALPVETDSGRERDRGQH